MNNRARWNDYAQGTKSFTYLQNGARYYVVQTERLRWPGGTEKPPTPFVLTDADYRVLRGISQTEYYVLRREHGHPPDAA